MTTMGNSYFLKTEIISRKGVMENFICPTCSMCVLLRSLSKDGANAYGLGLMKLETIKG